MRRELTACTCLILSVLLLIPVFTHCHFQYYQQESRSGKRKRQVFREDVSPMLGGRVPSAALEWTRLMFNNLDSRGISIPNGFIPSSDRVHSGAPSDEKRIVFFSNDSLEPFVASTYRLRTPFPTVTHSQRIEIIPGLPHEMISPLENNDHGHPCCNYLRTNTNGFTSSPASASPETPSIIPNHQNVKLQMNIFGSRPKQYQSYQPSSNPHHFKEQESSAQSILHPNLVLTNEDAHLLDKYRTLLVDDIIMRMRRTHPSSHSNHY